MGGGAQAKQVTNASFGDRHHSACADASLISDFTLFYSAYVARVRGFVRKHAASKQNVEDIVQEVFARAYRARDRLDPTSDPWPWLCTIARQLCRDSWRWARRHPEDAAAIPDSASTRRSDDPEASCLANERLRLVDQALANLSVRHRRVLLMHELGWQYEELSELEGLGLVALRSLVARAREALRLSFEATSEQPRIRVVVLPLFGSIVRRLQTLRARIRNTIPKVIEVPALTGATAGLTAAGLYVGLIFMATAPTTTGGPRIHAASSPTRVAVASESRTLTGTAGAPTSAPRDSDTARQPGLSVVVASNPDDGAPIGPASIDTSVGHEHGPRETFMHHLAATHKGAPTFADGSADVYCDAGTVTAVACAVADHIP